jgi:hypothetical protein
MELNVDVICNDTGEIFKEGVLLANAHLYIAKKNGKVVKDEVEKLELDDIDGGGDIEVRNLWVEFPEIQEEIRKMEDYQKRVKEYWGY